eukprot:390273-Pelagomonas_calceolata.AAC.5
MQALMNGHEQALLAEHDHALHNVVAQEWGKSKDSMQALIGCMSMQSWYNTVMLCAKTTHFDNGLKPSQVSISRQSDRN